MRRPALLVLAVLAAAGCGGAGARPQATAQRSSATQLGGLAARAQDELDRLGEDLAAVTASGAGVDDALVLQGGATSDAVGRLRGIAADVEQGAGGADPATRPAYLALGRATTAYLGVFQDLVVHQGSSAELARYLCRVPERRDGWAGVRSAVLAFDADARAVRLRTGVPVTQFGGAHAQILDDTYVAATYAGACLSSAVQVIGAGVLATVKLAKPDATAASGAREIAGFARGVVGVLGGGPPRGARTALGRLWRTTLAAAQVEQELWAARAAAYARGRAPSLAALLRRERAAVAVWLAAEHAL